MQSELIERFSPEVDFSTRTSRENVPFGVVVHVEDHTTGKQHHCEATMHAPRGVIDEINAKTPKATAVFRKLAAAVTPNLQTELMANGPWKCHCCQKEATKFVYNFLNYLHVDPPFLSDTMTRPVCSIPECIVRTERWCQNLYKEVTAMHKDKLDRKEMRKTNMNEYACAYCFKKEDKKNGIVLQQCGRCKHVQYCSKECQRSDWKQHKPRCIDISMNS